MLHHDIRRLVNVLVAALTVVVAIFAAVRSA
jgi:hypothetical protein